MLNFFTIDPNEYFSTLKVLHDCFISDLMNNILLYVYHQAIIQQLVIHSVPHSIVQLLLWKTKKWVGCMNSNMPHKVVNCYLPWRKPGFHFLTMGTTPSCVGSISQSVCTKKLPSNKSVSRCGYLVTKESKAHEFFLCQVAVEARKQILWFESIDYLPEIMVR